MHLDDLNAWRLNQVSLRWCYTGQLATTIFRATPRQLFVLCYTSQLFAQHRTKWTWQHACYTRRFFTQPDSQHFAYPSNARPGHVQTFKVMLHETTCNNDFSRNTASTFRAMLHESTFRATSYKMNLATCMLHETIFRATRLATFCVSKQRASRPCKQRWRPIDVVGSGVKTLLICFF